jgi:hypothetical protein
MSYQKFNRDRFKNSAGVAATLATPATQDFESRNSRKSSKGDSTDSIVIVAKKLRFNELLAEYEALEEKIQGQTTQGQRNDCFFAHEQLWNSQVEELCRLQCELGDDGYDFNTGYRSK